MIKVEVTAFGLGLNIAQGERRVVRPRAKASHSIINSGKIKHSWIKLNKTREGHGKKETSRILLFPGFFAMVQLVSIPGSLSLCQTLIEKDDPQEQPCWAWGLFNTWNELRISSWLKSTWAPFTKAKLSQSTTTLAPPCSNTLKWQEEIINDEYCRHQEHNTMRLQLYHPILQYTEYCLGPRAVLTSSEGRRLNVKNRRNRGTWSETSPALLNLLTKWP